MVKGQHIDINLIVHGDRRSYTAGSTVAGTVILKLSKDVIPIHHISVVFSGNADVFFSLNLDRYRRLFTNPTNLCTVIQKVWENHGQQVSSGLAAGVYEFPFGFQIPNTIPLPTSFQIKRGNYIQYSLFVGISQSGGPFDFS